MFLETLNSSRTDTLMQQIFSHLNDSDIDNSAFWLSVHYASTAVFQLPESFVINSGNCSPPTSSGGQQAAKPGPPGPGSQTGGDYDTCFTSSTGKFALVF